MIAHQQILILVGPRYLASAELGTGNAWARRESRGDPREEHQPAAEYGYSDEC
jgi:hypothetical protein